MDKDLKKLIDETVAQFCDELPLSGEEKYNKQEPGGVMSAVNVSETSFRIYNESLCPDLWDAYQHLDPRVRINLLRMAYDFYEKSKLPAKIIDIFFMGSAANYNWTPESDVDVHVIVDYNKLQMPSETASKTVKAFSSNWNLEHQVSMKGHKVEMNFQDANEAKPHVIGIYSLVRDKWVRVPVKINVQVDKNAIQVAYKEVKKYVEQAIGSGNRDLMKKVKEYVDEYRQYGLDTRGEISTENIVFKILRAKGLITMLKDAITATYDREMSVAESNDDYDDAEYEKANQYFSIGQDDDRDKNYCWAWLDGRLQVKRGGTHGINFGHERTDYTYKGWYDVNTGKISFVFPNNIRKNFVDREPTVNDIPQVVYRQLMNKFGKKSKPELVIFEVTVKNVKQVHPGLPQWNIKNQDYDINKLTLDHLKALRAKSYRFYKAAVAAQDTDRIEIEYGEYLYYDDEIKRRLKYINAPIIEGVSKLNIKSPDEMSQEEHVELNGLIKDSGINILSDKELSMAYFLGNKLVGALYTAYTSGEFSFDVIVGRAYRGQGIGARIIKDGLSEYFNQILDMDPEAKLKLDVVNPNLVNHLIKKGLSIEQQVNGHTIMSFKKEGEEEEPIDEGVGMGDIDKDPLQNGKERWRIKWGSRKTPKMDDVTEMINELVDEAIEKLSSELLTESPEMKTLKDNKKPLSDEERNTIINADAVWHHGPNGEKTPAVWKSEIKGKTWYVTNTHRAYQAKPTLKGAINIFHSFIKDTA